MIRASVEQLVCVLLVMLLAAPPGFAQSAAATPPAPAVVNNTPLGIGVLEGNNAVNSISLLHAVAVVVEIRDSNELPVEGAAVTFTLPAQGPGGSFASGGKTFTARSDARGQASAAPVVPAGAGKFQIVVSAVLGDRKGQLIVNQTNAEGAYSGSAAPSHPWYKRKLFWAVVGGAAAAVVVAVVLNRSSKSKSNPTVVVVTPGPPVFQ